MLVVEFVVRHEGEGPAVTARRTGTTWTFTWAGRRESSTHIQCDHAKAQKIAEHIASEVADLAPLRAELERREQDIAEWLRGQTA